MTERFDIIKRRMWFFILSGSITVAGLIVFLIQGFNLGTDFKAGSQLQVSGTYSTAQVQQMMNPFGVKVDPTEITTGSTGHPVTIIRLGEVLTPKQANEFQSEHPESQVNTVSPFEAQLTSKKAVWAVLLASLFIVIYVAIRFEYRFGVAGIVALLHDAFIVMSVFALLRMPVTLLFVTAILTIVGYSINDTIVIFDRIRENLKLMKPSTFEELEHLTNKSLWQTMTRSINTVTTVLIAALMLFFFGGASIHDFTFALIVGLVSGAYSSIFIASPIWVVWRGRSMERKKPVNGGETA